MATKEELQAQADAEIEAAKPMYKQVNNERMEFMILMQIMTKLRLI